MSMTSIARKINTSTFVLIFIYVVCVLTWYVNKSDTWEIQEKWKLNRNIKHVFFQKNIKKTSNIYQKFWDFANWIVI